MSRRRTRQATTDEGEYVAAVRCAIDDFSKTNTMRVRLLLSLDRARVASPEAAHASVAALLALAERFRDVVVGLDICGDPRADTVRSCAHARRLSLSGMKGSVALAFHRSNQRLSARPSLPSPTQ